MYLGGGGGGGRRQWLVHELECALVIICGEFGKWGARWSNGRIGHQSGRSWI